MRGTLIAFEGLDGSGLTTQAQRARNHLKSEGWPVYLTKQPTDGPVGAQIRVALSKRIDLDPESLALLFAADRMDHLRKDIVPKLENGVTVLCDRYYLSSFAYQSLDIDDLEWLKTINSRCVQPDLTVLFDAPALVCRKRIQEDRWHVELFEEKDKMENVRENYHAIAKELREQGENIELVDAARPVEDVADDVLEAIEDVMDNRRGAEWIER